MHSAEAFPSHLLSEQPDHQQNIQGFPKGVKIIAVSQDLCYHRSCCHCTNGNAISYRLRKPQEKAELL